MFHSSIEPKRLPNPKDIVVHRLWYAHNTSFGVRFGKLVRYPQGAIAADDIQNVNVIVLKIATDFVDHLGDGGFILFVAMKITDDAKF